MVVAGAAELAEELGAPLLAEQARQLFDAAAG
jgi:hypothetical protein